MPSPFQQFMSYLIGPTGGGTIPRVEAALAQADPPPPPPPPAIPATTYTPGSDYKPLAGAQLKAFQAALAKHTAAGARVKAGGAY